MIWAVWSHLHPCTGCARKAPGLLVSSPRAVVPWPAPEQRRFVLVNLQGCPFPTFPRRESREEGGGGRKEEGCCGQGADAGNAASGQRATLPLCCCSALRGCCSCLQLPGCPSQPGERLCSPVRLLQILSSAFHALPPPPRQNRR